MTEEFVHFLEVRNLRKTFPRAGGAFASRRSSDKFAAVDDVRFFVTQGATFPIGGEGGCGKTPLARMLLRLIEPDCGRILLEGRDLLMLSAEEIRAQRRQMQMIFQDPYASLNPRMRVGEFVAEPLAIHEPQLSRAQREAQSATMLQRVGLGAEAMPRYAHEFS